MPAKELTEANCHPRYSCLKPLLIGAIFIRLSDRMLFTLTTLRRFLPQLLCAIHEVSGSLHLSKTMAQHTQNASL